MNVNIKSSNHTTLVINKKNLSMKMIFVLIGMVSTLITLLGGSLTSYNNYQFLLPISYTIAYILLAPSVNRLGFGYFVLNIIWVIRYCILPAMNIITEYNMYQVDEKYFSIALFIMFIELWVTFLAVKYYYIKFSNVTTYSKSKNLGSEKATIKNISPRLILLFFIMSFIIILMDPNALRAFNFILNQDFNRNSGANFGTSTLILNWTKYLVTVYLIGVFRKKYEINKSILNVITAILIMFISISLFKGTSRNGILIEAVAYVFVLIRLFPKHKKKIGIISAGVIFFIILSITMYRFYDTRVIAEAFNIYNINNLTSMFNSYFSGQHNVAIGVKTLDLFWGQYNFHTILKDLFANTVFLNNFVSDIPGTVYYFNHTFYGHTLWADQISPTITQVIGLFNIFGFFIPVLIIYIIIKMDIIAMKEEYGLGIFIATLFAVNLAFYSPGNITIIATSITNKLLPLYLIYKITTYRVRRS